jgi:hypothetical protein
MELNKTVPRKEPTGMLAYIIAAREIRTSDVRRKVLLLYYASMRLASSIGPLRRFNLAQPKLLIL